MPGGVTPQLGNTQMGQLVYVPITFATTVIGTPQAITVSVPGVMPGDLIIASLYPAVAGIAVTGATVSVAGSIVFFVDASAVVTGATAHAIVQVIRAANISMGVSALPTQIT